MIFSRLITAELHRLRDRGDRTGDAVDPRPDDHLVLLRLEVDVGGAVLDALCKRRRGRA